MNANATLILMDQVQRLTRENAFLRESLTENGDLRQELRASTSIRQEMVGCIEYLQEKRREEKRKFSEEKNSWLEEKNSLLEEKNSLLEEKNSLLEERKSFSEENRRLFKRTERLKQRACEQDCVICVIVNVLENRGELGLGVKLCCPQLRTIISSHATSTTTPCEPKHFMCNKFMDILNKCGIVAKLDEYKYPAHVIGRENEMVKAFEKLMTVDRSLDVIIIARVISEAHSEGHAELCYLNTRTTDGKVTIVDPQLERSGDGGQQNFIEHVRNDEGVIFYTVNMKELKKIINHDRLPYLHSNTSNHDPAFGNGTADVDGDC